MFVLAFSHFSSDKFCILCSRFLGSPYTKTVSCLSGLSTQEDVSLPWTRAISPLAQPLLFLLDLQLPELPTTWWHLRKAERLSQQTLICIPRRFYVHLELTYVFMPSSIFNLNLQNVFQRTLLTQPPSPKCMGMPIINQNSAQTGFHMRKTPALHRKLKQVQRIYAQMFLPTLGHPPNRPSLPNKGWGEAQDSSNTCFLYLSGPLSSIFMCYI